MVGSWKIKLRAIISVLLLVTFLIVAITGIGLAQAPSGKIAYATSWTFLGMDKPALERAHTLSGIVMIALVLVHLAINLDMLVNELKVLTKR